jgi:hypothetical protein
MRIRPAACSALLVASLVPVITASSASAAAAKYADDFNGDGYRDYATEWLGDSEGGGVLVTFGTANGPGTRTQFIDQSSPAFRVPTRRTTCSAMSWPPPTSTPMDTRTWR